MDSWVRYSVTVYFGLLLAGTLLGGVPMPATPGRPFDGGLSAMNRSHSEMRIPSQHITRVTLPSCATATVPLPPA